MDRKSSVYLFCSVLIMMVFCMAVPCTASSLISYAAAKEKYNEGVKLVNYEARRAAFQKAVDLCPSYAEAHVNLADAFENLGLEKKRVFGQQNQIEGDKFLDKAERHYKRAIELKPALIGTGQGKDRMCSQPTPWKIWQPHTRGLADRTTLLKPGIGPRSSEKIYGRNKY